MAHAEKRGSTPRVRKLYAELMQRALTDRSSEWLEDEMFHDVAQEPHAEDKPVIQRRADAFRELLETMTRPEVSKTTHTYEIQPGELIVGVMPLGSLGLGKVFPNYLTDTEKVVAFYSARGVESNLGHNSPNYTRVVEDGLDAILAECSERLRSLRTDYRYPMGRVGGILKKIGFYQSVQTCCRAVLKYACAFARLAARQAATTRDPERQAELQEIARVCRKVPRKPADTFHEALQSIWFVHLALHASVSHLSLGRLDQVLQPYLKRSMARGQIDRAGALELIECFFIKAAGRLNLNPAYFEKQDHQDFGTGMGHSPFLVDQEVTVNQFMQNIVVGGQTTKGNDATNECTYLFLEACANLGLPTPTVNVRLFRRSSKRLIRTTAECVLRGRNGMPIIYNDEVIVRALMQPARAARGPRTGKTGHAERKPLWGIEHARDYVIDGCWEPLLNGTCDFTYNMVHMLPILECALNGGALLTKGKMHLRGKKESFMTKLPSQVHSFRDLQAALRTHLKLFTKRAGLQLYANFCLEGSVTPAPFFSAILDHCLRKGIDKTWGGADHIIGGIVFIAMPNVANALAAIKRLVFDKKTKKYTLQQVVEALRTDYEGAKEMWDDFGSVPKFGNGDPVVDGIMKWLMDEVYEAIQEAQVLADEVFLTIPRGSREGRRFSALRVMAMYAGPSYRELYGKDFDMRFTVGCGTFAQYVHFGIGCAASADGRHADAPVAPNFSPASGTATCGAGAVFKSMKGLDLDRFGCGVMTDLCIEGDHATSDLIEEIIRSHCSCGSILSLTVAQPERLKAAYEQGNAVREDRADPSTLDQYADMAVRVGGWNAVFITLTKAQQEDYLARTLGRL